MSAKEKGLVYVAHNGKIELLTEVAEHPETYSDKEGFFLQSGPGSVYRSGSPLEINEEHNIKQFVRAISKELNEHIKVQNPKCIYLFYPKHLKGYLENVIQNPKHIKIKVMEYGNFLHMEPLSLLRQIQTLSDTKADPREPASVSNGPNVLEKKKLLKVRK